MLLYIKNLLPRLRQYSQTLDKIELLVEHPWVLIDDEGNQQKYIFQRNGELIMSLNGKVAIGTWKYLATSKSLLIDRIQDKILLNHDFVHPAVMALKMDGNMDLPFVLANENLIPDMDVVRYLEEYMRWNGILLPKNPTVGISPEAPTEQPSDSATYKKYYNTYQGLIHIEQKSQMQISRGDSVFMKDKPAPDGKYRFTWMEYIIVEKGIVVKYKDGFNILASLST